MSKVYIAAAFGVNGFSAHKTKSRAIAAAKQLGQKWWVMPATKTLDSTEKQNEGGYRPFFVMLAAKESVYKAYTIAWQKTEDCACWCSEKLSNRYILVKKSADYAPFTPIQPPWEVKPNSPNVVVLGDVVRRQLIEDMVTNHPAVEEAWESQGTVGVLLISRKPEDNGWGKLFDKRLGITVASGGKDVKRMVQHAHRSYLSYAEFLASEMTLQVIEDSALATLLDGIYFVSQLVWDRLVEELIQYQEKTGLVSDGVIEAFMEGKVGNCRVYYPGVGMIKGNVVVSKELTGYTILTHIGNIKTEVKVSEDQPIRIGVVPYLGKFRSRTNIGYIVKGIEHMGVEDVMAWVTQTFDKFRKDIEECKVELELAEVYAECNRGEMHLEGHYVGARQKAELWSGMKNPLKGMPESVLTEYLKSKGAYTVDEETADVRARIPFSTYCQVVSYETAKTIDSTLEEIPEGHIAYYEARRFFVVNNADYEKHIVGDKESASNHDSPDQDDTYTQLFRRKTDEDVWVTLLRNPVGWGQYSEWKLYGDLPCGWATNQIPAQPLGIQKSTMRSMTKLLPSPLLKGKKASWDKQYGPGRFEEALWGSGGSAGSCYNLLTLNDLDRRDENLNILDDVSTEISPSEVIDAFTQGDNPENLKIIDRFIWAVGKKVSSRIIAGKKIDRAFWDAKGKGIATYLSDKAKEEMEVEETYFTKIVDHAAGEKKKYLEFVSKWVKDNATIPTNLEEWCKNKKLKERAAGIMGAMKSIFTAAKKEEGCSEVGEDGVSRMTDDGWAVLNEMREHLLTKTEKELEELAPYLAYHCYFVEKKDTWILAETKVFHAYAKWCKDHAVWTTPEPEEKKHTIEISYTKEGVNLVVNGEFEIPLSKEARFVEQGGKHYLRDMGGVDLCVSDMGEENKVTMREVYAFISKSK